MKKGFWMNVDGVEQKKELKLVKKVVSTLILA